MKQRCLLLLSLFLATLTGAWAQDPTVTTVTGSGVNACAAGGARNLSVSWTSTVGNQPGFTYRMAILDSSNTVVGSAAIPDIANDAAPVLVSYTPPVTGANGLKAQIQSAPTPPGTVWSGVGTASATFNVGVTPANIPAFSVSATPSAPNPNSLFTSANNGGGLLAITTVCSNVAAPLTFNVTGTDCQGTQQRQWAFNTTGVTPPAGDPSWAAVVPTTQPNDGQTYFYWSRCVNLSPLCIGPATRGGIPIRGAARVIVNPTPTATAPTLNPSTICAGYAAVPFDGNGGCPGGTTTQWWREDPGAPGTFDRLSSLPATTGVAYGPAGNETKYPAINSLGGATTQTITFYASCIDNNGAFCESPRQPVVLTIKPTPGFLTQLPNLTTNVCSGTALNFDIAAALSPPGTLPAGTTYAWAAPVVANITGTSTRTAPGTSANLTDNLVNATNANIDVVYNVTATADGCSLDPNSKFTMTVTVKPTPAITPMTTTICGRTVIGPLVNTGDFTVTPVNGVNGIVPAAIRYDWAAPVAPGITGLAAGVNQTTINGQLTNNTNAPVDVVYTVTPTYTGGPGADCPGAPFTVTVTVNPTPGVDAAQTRNICSGETFQLAPIQGFNITPANTQYSWPLPVAPGINGLASGTNQATVSGTLTNTTNATIQVNYVVSQTAYGCVGNNFNVLVDVKPVPAIANKNLTVCSLYPASLTLINGTDIVPADASMKYDIAITGDNANVDKSIAFPTTITGNNTLALGVFSNNTNVQQSLVLTVTPTYIGGPGANCPGAPFTITVFVDPTPEIANKTVSVCSESSVTVTPTNNEPTEIVPAGTTYTWTVVDNPNVTGDINQPTAQPNFTTGNLTNNTTVAQVVVYTVTPTAGTCVGATFTVTVTVNPKPVITTVGAVPPTICASQTTTLTFNLAGIPGVDHSITYSQTAGLPAVTSPVSPLSPVVPGNFSFTSTPPSGDPMVQTTMTYTIGSVTYTANGITCNYTLNAPSLSYTLEPEPPIPFGAGGAGSDIVIKDPITNKSVACESSAAAPVVVAVTNDATCGAGFVTKWYNDNTTPFGPGVGLASAPATINTVTGQAIHPSQPTVLSPGTITWYVACKNEITGCETPPVKRKAVSFTVIAAPLAPVSVTLTPNQACQTAAGPDATFIAAVNCTVGTPVWYTADFPSLAGRTTTAPSSHPTTVPTTTTWYVACQGGPNNCESLSRTSVTFTVNPAPVAPGVITLTPSSICQQEPGTPNLAIKPISDADARCVAANGAGFTGVWYAAATGGSAIANPVVDVTVWGPVTFYVACKNPVTLCESLTRQAVTFTVLRAPLAPAPITLTPSTACASTPSGLPMNNNATCTGSSGNGEANVWYSTATGGVPLSSAPNTTPATTTTWYVACRNLTTGCESLLPRTPVTFTVFPTPTVNALSPNTATYCNNAPVSALALSGTPATAVAPNSKVWFKYSGGASIGLANGTTDTGLPAFTATNSGTVVVNVPITITPYTFGPNGTNDGGTGDDCLGASITYTITVIPTPSVTFTCPAPVCANDAFSAIAFSGPVAGTVFNWTNNNTTIGLGAAGSGNIASFTGLNASTTMSNIGLLTVTPSVTVNSVTCVGPDVTCNLVVKPRPSSNLTASQDDVCPNTEVTLDPKCSIPTSSLQWGNGPGSALPAPAGQTVTPTAPDLTYIYTVVCIADGCAGNMSDDTVRTHRLLVDIVKVNHPGGDVNQPGPVVEVRNDLGKDLSVPKNTIVSNDGSTPRTWNILARPCYAPVGSISFEFLAGPLPLNFKTVDNYAPHAFFANDGANAFYSQASASYGPGSVLPFYTGGTPNFPNGVYTVLVQGRTNTVAGAIPAGRNKLSGGALLSTRTVTFEVKGTNPGGARIGVEEEVVDAENWVSLVQNPISEEIMVRISGKVGDNVQLNLSNLQGQEVHQSNLQLETTSQLNKINARDFSTGFYILKAVNGDKVKTIKVLKVQ